MNKIVFTVQPKKAPYLRYVVQRESGWMSGDIIDQERHKTLREAKRSAKNYARALDCKCWVVDLGKEENV
jgi:hypothetical protein